MLNCNCFSLPPVDLGDGNSLHFVNIEKLEDDLITYIDNHLVSICEGKSSSDIRVIKKRLINFLKSKTDSTLEMGAIAEFFLHLYFKSIGLEQKFLYLNLEEKAIKKGFDGYYTYKDDEWIFESKSGNHSTASMSHRVKIKESYSGLQLMLAGETTNDPWMNAFNHASHRSVKSKASLRDKLKAFSDDYVNEDFKDIQDFNIIPGSTIYMDSVWEAIDQDALETDVRALITTFKFKKL